MKDSGANNLSTRLIEADIFRHGTTDNSDTTLWTFASPGAAAHAAVELYGSSAATAAAYCALTARYDGRNPDYRFWFAVFKLLRASDGAPLQKASVTGSC